ncbi:FAD-binding oxidoreductase [Roseomonas stagni]|uniref:FAD-binding oxidoreductase n=1 Tax=Falsiroseomonas algicola TaxID=2716930 RepID=A0A6M1LKB2_9PROT|nr:FAD-binding oxidoreductase [Falsiroseomonas algicola]NGM20775.1 FAD-binding oxidoreductase [Falsiroseomonas algicola]
MDRIAAFAAAIGDVPCITDPAAVRLRSRDRFAVSPMLRKALKDKFAEVIVTPRTREEIARVLSAACRLGLPVTPRGGGTANFGQSVPLEGGVLLDMTGFAGVVWQKPGVVRVKAGTMCIDVDAATRPQGWELRIHPSTKRSATIAGFISGGHAGIGSCVWGMLADKGNILALEVMSMEEEPRVVELRGADIALVHHAYGANAVILECEMPLAPAWEWRECLAAFPDFMQAVRFGVQLAQEDAIIRKLVSIQGWPIPRLIKPMGTIVPDGHSMVSCLIAAPFMDAFRQLVAEHGGIVASDSAEGEGPYGAPLYEFSWGHSNIHIQKSDPRFTGVMGLFPTEDLVGSIGRVHARYPEAPMRLELERTGGKLLAMGTPAVLYESEAQMAALVQAMQAEGVSVANSHSSSVKKVGIKQFDARDAVFKRVMDPKNLLNPGKLVFDAPEDSRAGVDLPTSGWSLRKAL